MSGLGVRKPGAALVAAAPDVVSIALPICALVLWAGSLRHVDLGVMNDTGLISVLPLSFFAAIAVLTASFFLALHFGRLSAPVVLLHVGALILILFATAPLLEPYPRFLHTWLKAGVTDYIMRHGGVNPYYDHNFNWPGFYMLSAFLTEVAGLHSPLSYAGWMPLVLNVLYLGPLVLLLRVPTGDERLVWLGVWLFYIGNWIGQDYYAPQGFAFFLYLVLLAVLLTWFKSSARTVDWPLPRDARIGPWRVSERFLPILAPADAPNTPATRSQRVGLLAILLLAFVVMVASHELSPIIAVLAVSALVILGRSSLHSLPVLMLVIVLTWMGFMAVVWMSGNFAALLDPVGHLGESVGANVGNRVGGSPAHQLVVFTRLVMSGLIWLLALAGGIRSIRRGYWDLSYAVLAIVPFPMLALDPYGGEMLLRVYLFALPFMVFFAASLFYTAPSIGLGWRTTMAAGVLSLLLLVAAILTRYGNERMDYYSPSDVRAIQYVYSQAPPGSLLVAASYNIPWEYQGYETYTYRILGADLDIDGATAQQVSSELGSMAYGRRYPAVYLISTQSQQSALELFNGQPPHLLDKLNQRLSTSRDFQLVYSDGGSRVYEYRGGGQ